MVQPLFWKSVQSKVTKAPETTSLDERYDKVQQRCNAIITLFGHDSVDCFKELETLPQDKIQEIRELANVTDNIQLQQIFALYDQHKAPSPSKGNR